MKQIMFGSHYGFLTLSKHHHSLMKNEKSSIQPRLQTTVYYLEIFDAIYGDPWRKETNLVAYGL